MKVKIFLLFKLFLLSCFAVNGQTDLKNRLDALLQEEMLQTSDVGIAVYDLTSDTLIYVYQDKKLYRPASVQKLITSISALSLLGEAHAFKTSVSYTGKIEEGVLKGDLYVIGGFDAEFEENDMDSLINCVLNSGIHTIEGNLYGDVSMTDSVYWGNGWSWDDAPSSYQPYFSPLLLNKGCVEIKVRPGQTDSLAIIETTPVSSYFTISNLTKSNNTTAGKFEITRNWMRNENHIIVKGNVSSVQSRKMSLYTSREFFMHLFLEKLLSHGVKAPFYQFNESPSDTSVIQLGTCSHTLLDLLEPTLKESDNLCAEAIFYHLASHSSKEKRVGSKEAIHAIEEFIDKNLSLSSKNYRIADGSGLSPYNYMSPELILDFLKYAYREKTIYEPLYLSLPVAGIDGTLKYRMKEGKTFKNIRAKTGTVTGVCSLAGYAKATNGHMLAFVILNQNMLKARDARVFLNKVCEELCR